MELNADEVFKQANDISKKLQKSVEQLCIAHSRVEESIPLGEKEMSFAVIGNIGAIIDMVETIKKEKPSEDAISILREMIADGEKLNDKIQLYLNAA